MKVSIAGVALLASLIGVSGVSAQTPTPDPAPTPPPPPPVVEPAPPPVVETPTTTATAAAEPAPAPARPKPKSHRKDARDREKSPVQVPLFSHPTFAEAIPNAASRTVRVKPVPASAAVAVAPDAHGSPIALVLVFVLGSASLLVVALKDVRIEGFSSVQAAVSDHRGEVAYASVALLLGVGVGLLATFGLT